MAVATVRLVMEAPRLVRDCATPTSPPEPQFVAKHGPRGDVRGRFGERFELVVRSVVLGVLAVNKLQDASGLENLIHLAELHLDNNQITNITGLKNLKNLARVWLDINRITNLDVFAIDKTKLKVLILTNNDITDIFPLGNLINLQHLEINQNKVSNISSLYHLRQLSAVLLGGNSPLINKTDIVKLQDILGPAFGCETYDRDVCVAQPTSCRNCIFCQGTKSNDQFHFNPNKC